MTLNALTGPAPAVLFTDTPIFDQLLAERRAAAAPPPEPVKKTTKGGKASAKPRTRRTGDKAAASPATPAGKGESETADTGG